jgi:TPR repeat protein
LAQLLASDNDEFKNRGRVRELLRSAAERGHLRATIQLGVDLHLQATAESQGAVAAKFQGREWQSLADQSKKNIAEALKWMTKATQQGDAHAYSSLASFYGHGAAGAPRALAVDIALQSKYLKLAAARGEVWSQHRTGMNFLHGFGVEKSADEAKRWLALAARQQAIFGYYPVTEARKKINELEGRVDGMERVRGGEACSHIAFR